MRTIKTKKLVITLRKLKNKVDRRPIGYTRLVGLGIILFWFSFFGKHYSVALIPNNNFKLPSFKKKKAEFKHWFKYYVLRSKVYFEASTTDCDCVTSEWDGVCENIWAYKEMEETIYENAEGATGVSIISKKEYRDYHHTTDHIMNAFENGRGRSINV